MEGYITANGRLIITSGAEKHDKERNEREDMIVTKTFVALFDNILEMKIKGINRLDKNLLCFVMRYNLSTKNCYNSNDSLAKKLDSNTTSISRSIKRLVEAKLLERNMIKVPGGEVRLLSVYRNVIKSS